MEMLLRLLHRRRPAEGWLLWSLALLTLLLLAAGAGGAADGSRTWACCSA